jgi:hypothetical protein
MVSDAGARKAGLHRSVEPAPQPNNYAVAVAQGLEDLKKRCPLDRTITHNGSSRCRSSRWRHLPRNSPLRVDPVTPPVMPLHRPIIRDGDRFVVAAPHFLLPALIRALLELAREDACRMCALSHSSRRGAASCCSNWRPGLGKRVAQQGEC